MSRNGSGTYSLPAGNPVVTGSTISSSWANSTLSDIASALTGSIASDGQTTPTANLPMGTYAHTGVGNATARTMYASAGQVQDSSLTYLTSVSGTNAITATAPIVMVAYATGQTFRFIAANATTGAVTININSIGLKSIVRTDGSALVSGDIAAGAAVQIMYDGTNFQLLSDANGKTETVTNLTVTGTLTTANDASISGLTVGKGANAVANNTALGVSALANGSLSGNYNTGVGYRAGYATTSGNSNAAFGGYSLYTNTTGSYNTALGGMDSDTYSPMYSNTTGSYNTALGSAALAKNTTASNNTAVGYQAGYSNTTGTGSIFIGQQAGYSSNSTGSAGNNAVSNTIVGAAAGYSLTSGYGNTFLGAAVGYSVTTGVGNTIIGPSISGVFPAGYYMTTGSKNTIIGSYSGNQGGLDIRTASNYIVLSDGDGNPRLYSNGSGNWTSAGTITTTSGFVASGCGVGINVDATANTIFTSSLGAASTTMYIGNKSINTTSDIRIKDNIKPTERNAIELLSQWEIVDHTWNDPTDTAPVNRNSRGVWTGAIAQQIIKSTPWLVHAEDPTCPKCLSGEHCDEHESVWQVDYDYAVPLLVKAIQELKAEVDALKAAK